MSSPDLPTGTLTFLLTDVVGSSRMWETEPEAMSRGLSRHDQIVAETVERHGGFLPKQGEGDSTLSVFRRATDGVACALFMQLALLQEPWETQDPIAVRMALHTGEPEIRGETYFGTVVNRCARLRAIAQGGQILLSQPTFELVRETLPEGTTLSDLGSHRLRDLLSPEHVYQLCHPGLPDEFEPLRAPGALNNLPAQLTSFIGRRGELGEVIELLSEGRLVTLTGSGGCGKTRLALQGAGRVLDEYPHGVWLVELAPVSDAALVPETIARTLGVRDRAGMLVEASLADDLRTKQALLILDNCEHLVTAVAEISDLLLRSAPELKILATSRESLGLIGEIVWRVPSLGMPTGERPLSLEELAQYEAVRLFVDRATLVNPSFVLGPDNAPAVLEICRRLDGIPLALELAAARTATLSVQQINERLGDAFSLLTAGSRSALPRQQTLRALVDWSYLLLDHQERLLFNRLSVFSGGFSLEAAEQICSEDGLPAEKVLETLFGLVNKSMVTPEERDGEVRYSLLELLRSYAQEKLSEGEAVEWRNRHLAWFISLAESAEESLTGPDQAGWLNSLETEHDNFRAALAWSVQCGLGEGGQRLAAALSRYWETRGHLSEGGRWLDLVLAAGRDAPAPVKSKAQRAASRLALFRGEYPEARTCAEESLDLARELGDRTGEAKSLQALANVALARGEYSEAEDLYGLCLTIQTDVADQRGSAISLANLGVIAWVRGDYPEARSLYQRSLEIQREIGDRRGVAASLNNLAVVAQEQGDVAGARAILEEALEIHRDVGDRRGTAAALGNLGNVANSLGDFARAEALYQESLSIQEELDEKHGIAESLTNLGNLARELGDLEGAASHLERASAIANELGEKKTIAAVLMGLGRLARARGELSEALRLYREALTLEREMEDRRGMIDSLEEVAAVCSDEKRFDTAARLLAAASALREAIRSSPTPADRSRYEAEVARVRAAMEVGEFESRWAEGSALDFESAVEEAANA